MAKPNHTHKPPPAANDSVTPPAELAVFVPRTPYEAMHGRPYVPPEPPPILPMPPMKAERLLTVSLLPEARSTTPFLRLRGRWLEQAGFPNRTRVRVQVANGCLTITPVSSPTS